MARGLERKGFIGLKDCERLSRRFINLSWNPQNLIKCFYRHILECQKTESGRIRKVKFGNKVIDLHRQWKFGNFILKTIDSKI